MHAPIRSIAPRPAALAALLLAPVAALAQGTAGTDVQNLDPQLPADVEDAEPARSGTREAQLPLRFTRENDGDTRLLLEPRFQMGFGQRWQANVGVPFVVGSSDRTNSGNVRASVMWKWLDEGSLLPAIALGGGVELPTGKDAAGTDWTLRLLATKTLGDRPGEHRIHGNMLYRINDDPRPDERDDSWNFILGYSTALSPATVFVADVQRGHGRLGATGMATTYGLGVRHAWMRGTVLSLGLALGSGADAPDWAITAGLQQAF
jgi:hypothetical protein